MACAILMLALLQLTSMQQKRHWVSRDSQSSDFCATGSLDVDQIENNSQTANNDRNEKRKALEAQTSASRAKLTVHVAHLEVPPGELEAPAPWLWLHLGLFASATTAKHLHASLRSH